MDDCGVVMEFMELQINSYIFKYIHLSIQHSKSVLVLSIIN